MSSINPLLYSRIGIATTYGKPYYRFANSLKKLNITFDSLLPEDITDYEGSLVLTTKKEAPKDCKKPIMYEDVFDNHITIIRAMMIQKLNLDFQDDELILGVDPGQRMGLSVLYSGREIENSLHPSVEKLVMHIVTILGKLGAKRKVVKIGNGNMDIAKEICDMLNLKYCSSFELEFVDEKRTSLRMKNYNQRGKRDMLAAKFISQREGYRHFILPLSMTG